MNTREIISYYSKTEKVQNILEKLKGKNNHLHIGGIAGSFKAFLAALAFIENETHLLVVTPEEESARYFFQDLSNILGKNQAFYLPSSFRKPYDLSAPDSGKIQERAEALLQIREQTQPYILVSSAEAIAEKIINQENLAKNQFELQVGQVLDFEFLTELLHTYSFTREDFVYEPGQFSLRGEIVDIFSFAQDLPVRVEMDGNQIESLRQFDPISQRSVNELHFTNILPNLNDDEIAGDKVSIFNYLPSDLLFAVQDFNIACHSIHKALSSPKHFDHFESDEILKKRISALSGFEIGQVPFFKKRLNFEFAQVPQKVFGKNFNMLIQHFQDNAKIGIEQHVFSETSKQIERLETIFEDMNTSVKFHPVYLGLSKGFLDSDNDLALYTEHEIFGKHYQYRSKHKFSKSQALTLRELSNLKPGDFIVHVDHGVGRFEGLQKIEMGGRIQESVRLTYSNNDLLYVNIGALHKISKYTGKDGHTPKINKLGSDVWNKVKSKTKKQVKDIARDLIRLYAKRKARPGFSYSPDNYLQVELEASFVYEDTPDQSKATEDVKKDMESPHPMDRLVCGDVGFGKTEIAIRAAFKAVCDSKQVAILVPTTILAQQHYHSFKERFEGFPCTVEYVNRFRTAKQQTQTFKNVAEGKTDILIGTHKILSSKIKFKDLGLLIIDEEQKFGVAAKDKLKEFRANVDTLTLTATPIPRTLHFSLMGARDLSVINTPPPNRQPIRTELHVFDNEIFEKAVNHEIDRGGQVFVVHNRVRDIHNLAAMIRELSPKAKVIVGHGQMAGDELENVMMRFIEGEYDVLVATTIIESGLDISNANTIIINNAHFFGLSDLHQMRGRVGRSNKKAYCHLITPPIHTLTDDARRRLQAIEEFSDLGSGFNVAMRDLDIRGAGNLLGGEQSGFISEIGFDMYHKILDEAIQELREEEFSDLLEDNSPPTSKDCQVETDLDIMIPDNYVSNITERLNLYSELSKIITEEGLLAFRDSLKDRFGNIPQSVNDLLYSVRLKIVGMQLGWVKIRIKNGKLLGYFPNENNQKYYQSDIFGSIVAKVNSNASEFSLKQKANQLLLVTEKVHTSIQDFHKALRSLL